MERNGSAKSVPEAWLGRGRITTELPLRWCYITRAAASILLYFNTLLLRFESMALPLSKFLARSKQAP